MKYKAAVSHNNLAGLVVLSPQPASDGIQTPEYVYSGDRSKYGRGDESIILKYDDMIPVSEGIAVLTAFGIDTEPDSDVTVLLPDDLRGWAAYNGKAYRPDNLRHQNGYYRNLHIMIGGLEII